MASTRPLKLDEWGISWEEYKELTYFCLQYNRKKADAAALLTIKLSTPTPAIYHKKVGDKRVEFGTFLPHGSGRTSDPVAATAAKRDRLLADVHMIEQAAIIAGELEDGYNIYSALLKAVTTRGGVQAVMADTDSKPPCGKNDFYAARRRFFWVLREMKNEIA
jgi:hypothetical protein